LAKITGIYNSSFVTPSNLSSISFLIDEISIPVLTVKITSGYLLTILVKKLSNEKIFFLRKKITHIEFRVKIL